MSHVLDLAGRVALVSGAASELGTQFARVLAQAGAAVVLAGREPEALKTLRSEIEGAGGDAHIVTLNVRDRASIAAAVAHAETEVGPLDILVNHPGRAHVQPLLSMEPEDYDLVFATTTRGPFFLAQEVARRMIARARGQAPGTFAGGRIVNIASTAGLRLQADHGVYAMAKAAVLHMTRAMAREWGPHGVNVCAICPGPMAGDPPGLWGGAEAEGLSGRPGDLDSLLVTLCAPSGRHLNGALVTADGGHGL